MYYNILLKDLVEDIDGGLWYKFYTDGVNYQWRRYEG